MPVTTTAELNAALSAAKGGETITLAPGDYGQVTISNRQFASPVTLVAADPTKRPRVRLLTITGSKNIVVSGLDIGDTAAGQSLGNYVAAILGSSFITIEKSRIHRLVDGNFMNDGEGLWCRNSSNVKVRDTEFTECSRAAWFQRTRDLEVVRNNVHDIRYDGFCFASVQRALIDGNGFRDFHRSIVNPDDHSDAIQFWMTNETVASTDITIRNNVMMQGKGTAMQGVFMRDETNAHPYERVLMENNLLYQSGYDNGLTVIGGKDVTFRSDTCISTPGGVGTAKIRIENCAGVKVEKNVVDQIAEFAPNSGVVKTDNIIITTDPAKAALLRDLAAGATATVAGLVMPGYGYQPPAAPVPAPVPVPDRQAEIDALKAEIVQIKATVAAKEAELVAASNAIAAAQTALLAEQEKSAALQTRVDGLLGAIDQAGEILDKAA